MSEKSKLLTEQEAKEARERGKRYIASCAIEGIKFTDEEVAFLESLHEERIGYEEFRARVDEWIRKKFNLKAGK